MIAIHMLDGPLPCVQRLNLRVERVLNKSVIAFEAEGLRVTAETIVLRGMPALGRRAADLSLPSSGVH